jgi:hypothetical protein
VRETLAERFGGLTAYTLAPAEGHWDDEGERKRDDIVVFEFMPEGRDEGLVEGLPGGELERAFRQDATAGRSLNTRLL